MEQGTAGITGRAGTGDLLDAVDSGRQTKTSTDGGGVHFGEDPDVFESPEVGTYCF